MIRLVLAAAVAAGLAMTGNSGDAISAEPTKAELHRACVTEQIAAVDSTVAQSRRLTPTNEAVLRRCSDLVNRLTSQAPPPSLSPAAAAAPAPAPAPQPAPSTQPLPAGKFTAVNKNTLLDVAPPREQTIWGTEGPKGVTAYSGSAWDSKRECLLVNGGGHGNYGGNEVYAFCGDTWSRLTNPGGEPVSAHTYDGLVYAPNADRLIRFGGAMYPSGSVPDAHAWRFDPAARAWSKGAAAPVPAWHLLEVGGDYNPQTGEALFTSMNGFFAYHPVKDSWRAIFDRDGSDIGRTGALDPVNRRFVSIGGAKSALSFYSLVIGGRQPAPVTGNTEFRKCRHPGIAYEPSGRFAIWCGGAEVWAVDATTFVSTRYVATGTVPTKTNEIWGRWQYVPSRAAFIGLAAADQPVWLYTLPPKGTPGDTTQAPTHPDLQQLVDTAPSPVTLPAGEIAQCITIKRPGITVVGRGTVLTGACGGKAAIVLAAEGVTVEGVTAKGVSNGDNLALIRVEQPNATLRDLVSIGNDTGIMSPGVKGGTLTIIGGQTEGSLGNVNNPGQTHGWYLGYHDRVVARNFSIKGTQREGHSLKLRAQESLLEGFVLSQEGSVASRSIDYVVGGNHVIRSARIEHGPDGNLDIIGFARELGMRDQPEPTAHSLVVENSTIVCRRPTGCELVSVKPGLNVPIIFRRNTIKGVALPAAWDGGGNTILPN